ncbi:type II secretion system protein [Bacillus sp. Bva_UNVM-123]|uniref:type II secretion system protein n=1 Tax=Bacillus sp. Bva_UNVM-123 TaxID=2829798 RepID=UPI00391F6C51
MKKINEQKGYALILVLLTITIIGIFTPMIFSKLINNTQQFKKTEEQLQLRKLSDMGIIYVESAIDKASENAYQEVLDWLNKIKEKMELDPKIKAPTQSEIVEKYYQIFSNEKLEEYIPSRMVTTKMSDEKFQFKKQIDSIALENNKLTVYYTIFPSVNYDNFSEKNSVRGDKTIIIDISE